MFDTMTAMAMDQLCIFIARRGGVSKTVMSCEVGSGGSQAGNPVCLFLAFNGSLILYLTKPTVIRLHCH